MKDFTLNTILCCLLQDFIFYLKMSIEDNLTYSYKLHYIALGPVLAFILLATLQVLKPFVI